MPEPGVPVGWCRRAGQEERLYLPLSTVLRHHLVTGTTGAGKSGYLLSLILYVLTALHDVCVVLLDLKGETADELLTNFLPALSTEHQRDGLNAAGIGVIEPFGQHGVPLNPLAPVPGLAPAVQAHLVCQLVAELADDDFKPRMRSILSLLCQAVISVAGSFLDVLRLLREPSAAAQLAPRISNPELRDYLSTTFAAEPAASRDALRARLEWVLLIPEIRAMLCATSCLSGEVLLRSRLTIINLGGAPQGCLSLSRFMGQLLLSLLTGAVFARQLPAPHVMCVVDEWQELVRATGAAEVERLLAQARFKRVNLVLANQTLAQIPTALLGSLTTNIAVHLAFRPQLSDIKHLVGLLPVQGRVIDPALPDRVLSLEAERRLVLDRLACLPPRHALLGDLVAGQANIIRTLDVPYEEAKRRAVRVDAGLRAHLRRGCYGVPFAELLNESARPQEKTTTAAMPAGSRPVATPAPVAPRPRRGRPPLVLP